MNVGKSLKIALVKEGRNQKWLAEKLSMSQQNINNIANGSGGNANTIKKIASAFDMSASEFIALGE